MYKLYINMYSINFIIQIKHNICLRGENKQVMFLRIEKKKSRNRQKLLFLNYKPLAHDHGTYSLMLSYYLEILLF